MADFRLDGPFSGIDTTDIIKDLMKIERKPIDLTKNRIASLTSVKTEWQSVKTQLSILGNSVKSMTASSFWNRKSGASSDNEVLTAFAGDRAQIAHYSVTVHSLATSGRLEGMHDIGMEIDPVAILNEAGYSDAISAGTFTVNGKAIIVDVQDTTNTLLAKIEAAVDGMTATYNGADDTITLAYEGDIILGNPADTSNFLTVAKLYSGSGSVESKTRLGTLNTTATLDNARLRMPVEASGVFRINGVEIEYESSVATLHALAHRISTSAAGVTAYYDSGADRFVLMNKDTGSMGISVEDLEGNLMAALKVTGPEGGSLVLGANASYTVQGMNNNNPMTSLSNSNVQVASDLFVDFHQSGSVDVGVSADMRGVMDAVKNFIEMYNSTIHMLREKGAAAIEGDEVRTGPLQGERLVRDIANSLRTLTGKTFEGPDDGYEALERFGITLLDRAGTLHISDENLLAQKISENVQQAESFFREHLFSEMDAYINMMVQDGSGPMAGQISNRINSIDSDIRRLNANITRLEGIMERRERVLVQTFTAMEKRVAVMSSQLEWLLKQLGMQDK